MSFEILASGLRFPEGPAFAPDGALWGVELQGGGLFRWTPAGLDRGATGGAPNGLAFAGTRAWFCDADGGTIRRVAADGAIAVMAGSAAAPLDRPNDLAFDAVGTLVFTCPGNSRTEPTGTVGSLGRDGVLGGVAANMLFPNGLAFTPDGRELVVAETYAHRLWRGTWDAAARAWRDPRPWADVGGPIGPDGMAFADDGLLFVAIFGEGRIAVVDPAGRTTTSLATPGARPTNVALDPSGRLGLVVTEAERGLLLSYPAVVGRPCLF